MSKMGLHDPFGHLKHKLWPKERSGVKLTIWFPTIKSWESPWFPCVKVACNIPLKKSWWGLQLCFKPHVNRRFAHKVMRPQSHGSPNFGNFETPTWKYHLNVALVARHRVYYKGEGGGFPQVQAVVNLSRMSSPVARPNTKNATTMHLPTYVWLCASLCE
jgi:hypothetical protein